MVTTNTITTTIQKKNALSCSGSWHQVVSRVGQTRETLLIDFVICSVIRESAFLLNQVAKPVDQHLDNTQSTSQLTLDWYSIDSRLIVG